MTTPTPQKSPNDEIAQGCFTDQVYVGDICSRIIQALNAKDIAYNALLDKVQLIETERDELRNELKYVQVCFEACMKSKHEFGMKHPPTCMSIQTIGRPGTTYITAPCDCSIEKLSKENHDLKKRVENNDAEIKDLKEHAEGGGCQFYKHAENRKEIIDSLKKRVDSEYDRGVEDAAKVAKDRQELWESYGGCPMGGASSHLTVEGECEVIAEAILKLRRV